MVTFPPSPSFAVIVVKISKRVHTLLVRTKAPGLEEGMMSADRSRVGIGEVGVVKIGIGAIGKAVHAVRQKRRRKHQQESRETTNAKETSH
jgi:hypothetical protein